MENTTNSARQVVDINVRAYRFTELDEYLGTGDVYAWDMARAWNEWVPKLRTILQIVRGATYSEEVCTEGNLTAAFFHALQSVARVYNEHVDEAFNYFYCKEGAREWWNECEWENATADRWYDSEGRDVTHLVDLYGGC